MSLLAVDSPMEWWHESWTIILWKAAFCLRTPKTGDFPAGTWLGSSVLARGAHRHCGIQLLKQPFSLAGHRSGHDLRRRKAEASR